MKLFTHNKKDFLRRYTTNETWIHHFTPDSKRASVEWRGEGESRARRPKTQQSASKVMASVFWDMHGILLIDFLPKGQTNNSDYFIDLLDRLEDTIKKKRPHMAQKKPLFQQDNAPVHRSMKTMVKFNDKNKSFYKKGMESLEKR